ncbi:hypothetical protein BDN67DRAFT_983203 [Paxillus ammoniavirescens]|nr:hypothetical protein BDN67DRAFT_983203 [Paxillus ammoniavirescens]
MDDYYDFDAARENPNLTLRDRDKGDQLNAARNFDQDGVLVHWKPVYNEKTQVTRMYVSQKYTEEPENEEAMVRIQGVLACKDLPPFTVLPKNPNAPKHIKQSIMLAGLGVIQFNQAYEQIQALGIPLARNYIEGALLPFQGNKMFDQPALDIGILAHMSGSNFVHIEDNVVEFFRFSERTPIQCSPSIFCIRDIVEAYFSVMVFPTGQKTHHMFNILQSLALLDSSHSLKAEYEQTKTCPTVQSPSHSSVVLGKWRRVYEENLAEEADMELSKCMCNTGFFDSED